MIVQAYTIHSLSKAPAHIVAPPPSSSNKAPNFCQIFSVLIREVPHHEREHHMHSQYFAAKNWCPFQRGDLQSVSCMRGTTVIVSKQGVFSTQNRSMNSQFRSDAKLPWLCGALQPIMLLFFMKHQSSKSLRPTSFLCLLFFRVSSVNLLPRGLKYSLP